MRFEHLWIAALTVGCVPQVRALHTDETPTSGRPTQTAHPEGSSRDRDGDGFATTDCNDDDPTVFPGAPERCGEGIDRDCNGFIDDLDGDGDGHIHEDCVAYDGPLSVDDCDDTSFAVHGGVTEVVDGIDNDCDGLVDEGTATFDDDGDCFCEIGPCTGSVDTSCPVLLDSDCADTDPDVNPGALDEPDTSYIDANCDGLDGVQIDSVFLDPVGGSDVRDGLTPLTPVRGLGRATQIAEATGRHWVVIASGSVDTNHEDFVEGIGLAGRYDATAGWTRRASLESTLVVPPTGLRLDGWSTPTLWHQVRIEMEDAFALGSSRIALWAHQTTQLTLTECVLVSIDAQDGGNGVLGAPTPQVSPGEAGEPGCCAVPDFCPGVSPDPGNGGNTGSHAGGRGGIPGLGNGNGAAGFDGAGASGGDGGAGGGTVGAAGLRGDRGDPGIDGTDGQPGSPGSSIGTFEADIGYVGGHGTSGFGAADGGGGGGGGGGRGGTPTHESCSQEYGGAGGGGGEGGRAGRGGGGGRGGGASVALVLTGGSDVALLRSELVTGDGGDGGNGGPGSSGGPGGAGGPGGLGSAASESGGRGGAGGRGGDGADGGGGGGGPSIGVVCRDNSSVNLQGSTFSLGISGSGGLTLGQPAPSGRRANTDGC